MKIMKDFWPVRLKENVTVCVQPTVGQMSSYVLLEQEDWFEDEMSFVRELVTPEMYAFDIGANHGVYALSIAARMQTGHIWAFEPTVAPGKMLEKSIELNGFASRITWVHAGLSDQPANVEISTSINSELNSLYGQSGSRETIRLESLDAFIKANGIARDISFVKLDAEGEEIKILKGGHEFFTRQSPLVMFELKHGNEVNHGLIEAFEELGYQIYRLLNDINILVEFDRTGQDDILNLFACKPDRAEELARRGFLARTTDINAVSPAGIISGRNWADLLRHYPWFEKCFNDWQAAAAGIPESYQKALCASLMLHDKSLEAAQRVALLGFAEQQLEILLQQPGGAHYSAWLLKIHLLHLRNQRATCLNLCIQLLQAFAGAPVPAWPFILPGRRFFARKPRENAGQWLQAIIHEFIEYRQSFSSYFQADPLAGMQRFAALQGYDIEIERRRILAAKRSGRQVSITVPCRLIENDSPNNLIWRQILSLQPLSD